MIDKLITYMRQTTMYRSMLYFLLTLWATAIGLCLINTLPYDALDITLGGLYLMLICWISSVAFGQLVGAKVNPESSLISGLILTLIFGPLPLVDNLLTLTFVAFVASASKFVLVWRHAHVFNPAAFGVITSAFVLDVGASWWVGSVYLLPIVLVFGLYEARYKINRLHLIISFFAAYVVFFLARSFILGADLAPALEHLWNVLRYSPILFFAFVMLVEPLTSPAERNKRIYYGVLVALLAVWLPEVIPKAPYTLELSLLAGNVFAALSGNQGRILLKLKKKEKLAPNITGFWFTPSPKRKFKSGQYLHYTLPHKHTDSRGSRRFFTVASSPTEDDILLATKFAEKSSSFKNELRSLKTDSDLTALRPEGEFVMPDDTDQPLVFVAGGIGVTPFRSMVKYLLDTKQKRPITLIYAARSEEELVFKDIFSQAEKSLDLKIVYVLDNPKGGQQKGPLTGEIIKKHAPENKNTLFYISGPEPMVRSLMSQLRKSGVGSNRMKHDYFPGYSKKD